MIVVFSAEARSQLRGIAIFIAKDNPDRARSFARELKDKALAIGRQPLAYPIDERLAHAEIRRCVHRSYLILYRIERDTVQIVSIMHGARDYPAILQPGGPPP